MKLAVTVRADEQGLDFPPRSAGASLKRQPLPRRSVPARTFPRVLRGPH